MSFEDTSERATQNRVIKLFTDQARVDCLGYDYLGNWQYESGHSNIETGALSGWLRESGVSETLINKTLRALDQASALGGGRKLYDANKAVYGLLRYGVKVKEGAGQQNKTVWLIDWKNPLNNHFGIAQEVTISGHNTKRPDLVLYVNGIALGVIELKRSSVSMAEGIRQNLANQDKHFIRPFFTSQQLVMAGSDSEGLRYGTIETPEKHYYNWREAVASDQSDHLLDRQISQICDKTRFLELIHNFIVFDKGTKKLARHNQYFGVKAAQEHVARREGGIIWHTQGSGKSLTMVWLAKWIRENTSDARILLITDRTELDEQIEGVFTGVDEQIYRTTSGADLLATLNAPTPWLICSLVHKFTNREEGDDSNRDKDTDKFIKELKAALPDDFAAKGNLFVFVDECHRTQSGSLHDAMKALMPNAMFIGFTGTPLLKTDKQKSIEVFGPFIHKYKFDEAVADKVVLDLRYEARDIDQYLTSPKKVDEWFELKTKGLTELARQRLKDKWGTMQKILSSRDRQAQIVQDILMDMEKRPRLMDGSGNAMLVCSSVYQACKVYELFAQSDLAGKCAIITSYQPSNADIKGEQSGEGQTEKLHKYEIYRKMLADHFECSLDEATAKTQEFEKQIKERFINEPGQMRLLIVVDKLLTGFDAPSATYLYIDKTMKDHSLFQAICRVNRLDGDKEYGYIIDYKDLFHRLEGAIGDYTNGAFDDYEAEDVQGLLSDRLEKAAEKLENARETVKALCEPVMEPKEQRDYFAYFCGDVLDHDAARKTEPQRVMLYKYVAALVRAYANLANEMEEAGYSPEQIEEIKRELKHFVEMRDAVQQRSGDYLDMKQYEPAMRQLIDQYVRAQESQTIADFEEMGLIELIVNKGLDEAAATMPDGIKNDQESMAETIESNVRKIIIDEKAVNPDHYEKMSVLLDALITERRQEAIDYKDYLEKVKELCRQVVNAGSTDRAAYPASINSGAKRALYDNLEQREELTIRIDTAVRHTKEADWIGHAMKERKVSNAIKKELGKDAASLGEIMELVKNQPEYR